MVQKLIILLGTHYKTKFRTDNNDSQINRTVIFTKTIITMFKYQIVNSISIIIINHCPLYLNNL